MATTTSSYTERTIRVDRRDVFVTEAGAGAPVVLLHGGGPGASGMSNYTRNVDALAEHFRVIVPDMPGYGRSTKGVDPSDPFGDLAIFLRGLLDELELGRAHVVGNSYGGAAALRLALDRPDRVDRLVLMGPGGIGTSKRLPTAGLHSLLNYYTGEGPTRKKLERFIRQYLVFDGESVPAELVDARFQASIDPEVIASPPLRRPSGPGALRTLRRMDLLRHKRIRRITTPTLVLWGAQDLVNRPEGGVELARQMQHCDLYLVAETGHWVQWERAELFNRLTIDFLSGRTGR
jgi:2-hydroxy-6-oxonona-2,4-dienedioate hydrolase/4,5:9,10-diseco-3-hydroxy-5,9,17-trioxoandrosta-1(10),2-diene-4-oate hydrolase